MRNTLIFIVPNLTLPSFSFGSNHWSSWAMANLYRTKRRFHQQRYQFWKLFYSLYLIVLVVSSQFQRTELKKKSLIQKPSFFSSSMANFEFFSKLQQRNSIPLLIYIAISYSLKLIPSSLVLISSFLVGLKAKTKLMKKLERENQASGAFFEARLLELGFTKLGLKCQALYKLGHILTWRMFSSNLTMPLVPESRSNCLHIENIV